MAKFDPKAHLMKVQGGADYLETKWRLVWFRETWPHGTIETEALEWSDQRAVFRATVTAVDGEGNIRGKATGTKSCTAKQFPRGHIEKAETGAIGRALACLGFGTQFEPEFDEGDLLADSPVTPNVSVQAPQRPQDAPKPAHATPDTNAPKDNGADRAMKRAHAVAAKHGITHEGLRQIAQMKARKNGVEIASLSEATPDLLNEIADGIEAKPNDTKSWLTKQAELLPGVALTTAGNPDRFTN